MLSLLAWYLVMALFGLAALPLGWTWLRFLPDRGWGLLRPLGLLLVGWAVWLAGSFGLLRLGAGSGVGALLALGALGVWVLHRWGGGWVALRAWLREHRWLLLGEELLFLGALAFWVWYRIHDLEGIQYTERPMDFALFRAILRGGELPPADPWLSGFAISYYYLGYLIMAQVTALSGVVPGVAYNLAFASLAALTSGAAFTVALALLWHEARRRRVAVGLALLAVLLVLGISNVTGIFNTAFYRDQWPDEWFPPLQVNDLSFNEAGERNRPVWWWWASSRTLSDFGPDGGRIEIIDEFPFFSFMLGDMHPHVLALPFALLGVGVALNRLRGGALAVPRRWRGLFLPPEGWGEGTGYGLLLFALTAVTVGGMGMLNTWDFPTQLTLAAATWAIALLPTLRRERLRALLALAATVGLLAAAAALLYLPFYLSFRSQAEGIRLVTWRTLPHHYALMFGLFLLIVVPFVLAQGRAVLRAGRRIGARPLAVAAALLLLDGAALLLLLRLPLEEGRVALLVVAFWGALPLALVTLLADGDNPTPLLVAQLALAPLGLALASARWTLALLAALLAATLLALWARSRAPLPDHEESTLPAIAGGSEDATVADVALALAEPLPQPAPLQFALLLIGLAFLLTMGSELFFIKDGFGGRMNTIFKLYYQAWLFFALAAPFALAWLGRRVALPLRLAWLALVAALVGASLWYPLTALGTKANLAGPAHWDGRFWMAQSDPDRFAAVEWLDAQPGQRVVLEAPGGSYNATQSALSGFTGHSTLLGWGRHELQWRGSYEEPGRREPIIEQIYTNPEPAIVAALLDEWGVDFVAVTPHERAKYAINDEQMALFARLMTPVFQQGSVTIFQR